ncbi:MAG TPA: AAA family ATPase, partial [Polyangia bacterium]|nr:AAA family ATPase [Polyangia bacterium]
MLNWFEVENFKPIKKLRLDFRPFMVFVGPNGAGKTNLIEALTLFLDLLTEGRTEPIELYGGYDQLIRRAKRRARTMRFALSLPVKVPGPGMVMVVEVVLRSGSDAEGIRVESELLRLTATGRAPFVARWKNGELVELEEGELPFFHAPKSMLQELGSISGRDGLRLSWFLRMSSFLSVQPVTRLRLDASALRRNAQLQRSRHGRLLGMNGEGLPLAVERLRGAGSFRRVLARLQEVYPRIEDVETV